MNERIELRTNKATVWFSGGDEGIVVDVNNLKEDILKRGDSQVEAVENDGIEETWKG